MKFFKRNPFLFPIRIFPILILAFAACQSNEQNPAPSLNNSGASQSSSASSSNSSTSPSSTPTPTPTSSPSPAPVARVFTTDVLLFNGSGTWSDEVKSLISILESHGASYRAVSSAELDSMTLEEIEQYGTIVWPGGSAGTQSLSISSDTRARLREAVQEGGVSWIGFCAGAFAAVAPKGNNVYVGVVELPVLEYYYLENQGTDIAMTLETFADGSTRDLLWYGGPTTPDIPGGVIAKYPTNEPAITQLWSGKGFVILSGPHPAASQGIRDVYGLKDSDGLDLDLAWTLIDAAIHQKPQPAFKD